MTELFPETKGIQIKGQPAWCSDELWATLLQSMDQGGRFEFEFEFTSAERKILRKRPAIPVSVWSERHRVLTMSALGGAWRNNITPHLTDAMNLMALPYVREVSVCKVPQSGFSEAAHNYVGYCIDRDPGPVLYVYPDETTAKENSQDRVQPMIESSRRLKTYFTGAERDKSSMRINLKHMLLYFGWARSASRLANKPIKHAIADEIDKPAFDPGTREASAIDLIRKRLITFRKLGVSKFIKISTPTVESGNIWRELNASQIICDYWVRCPLCDQLQLMDFKGIHWPDGGKADAEEIRDKKLAWYECEHCDGHWDDDTRDQAARRGVWIVRGKKIEMLAYAEKFRPATVGLHYTAWSDYFISLSDSAAAFLEGQNDLDKLQDFLNSFAAMPWKDREETKSEGEILAHRIDLPQGVVPADAVALTCGIDMQQSGFWFVVRAWRRDLSSHLVQYGYLTSWADIKNLVFGTRYPVEGKGPESTMGIWRAALDTGGGKSKDDDWSKTEEAYNFIRTNGRGVIFGVKGASTPQIKKVTPRVIDKMARGNRPIPGGITLYFLDVDKFKDQFHWRLGRTFQEGMTDADGEAIPVQGQHMTLHEGTGIDYARQILAEERQKDKKGVSTWVAIRRDNHLLDCENLAAACADPEWAPSLQFIANSNGAKTKRRVLSRGVDGE